MPSPSKKAKPATSRAVPKKPAAKPAKPAAKRPTAAPAKKPVAPAKKAVAGKPAAGAAASPPVPGRSDSRRHVLSLSFLRDGDEFMARLETDSGQITELKNRALDQLLTLVAGELEDLLE
jgi:hypothetical protein